MQMFMYLYFEITVISFRETNCVWINCNLDGFESDLTTIWWVCIFNILPVKYFMNDSVQVLEDCQLILAQG